MEKMRAKERFINSQHDGLREEYRQVKPRHACTAPHRTLIKYIARATALLSGRFNKRWGGRPVFLVVEPASILFSLEEWTLVAVRVLPEEIEHLRLPLENPPSRPAHPQNAIIDRREHIKSIPIGGYNFYFGFSSSHWLCMRDRRLIWALSEGKKEESHK